MTAWRTFIERLYMSPGAVPDQQIPTSSDVHPLSEMLYCMVRRWPPRSEARATGAKQMTKPSTPSPTTDPSLGSGSRAFITGANGFIGRSIRDRMRADGWTVSGVDAVAGDDTIAVGDTASPGMWQHHMAGSDVVVHTAAVVSNTVSEDTCWKVNVQGTRRVIDAAVSQGVRRFVHLSSVKVFSDRGFPAGVDETWPVRPNGQAYVDTKVASEQVVLQAHAAGEIDATIIRPGDAYGPRARPWTIIPVEGIKAKQFLLPDGGRGIFSPIYIDDLVAGIVAAAVTPTVSGQVIILCGDESPTCATFFGHYARMLGRSIPTAPAALARRIFAVGGRIDNWRGKPTEATADAVEYFLRTGGYSNKKARALLGWEPLIDLAEGMARTEAWLRTEGYLTST